MKSWSSLNEFFQCINREVCYVILRNYEDINEDNVLGKDTDIDILCSDFPDFVKSARSAPISLKKVYRFHHKILIKKQVVNIDVKYVGDGYFDKKWEEEILSSRVLYNNQYYIPNNENSFYSLLYHSLIHKEYRNNHYLPMLRKIANSMDNGVLSSIDINRLTLYMRQKGYSFVYPTDILTTFNVKGVDPSMINKENRHLLNRFIYKWITVFISEILILIKWGRK